MKITVIGCGRWGSFLAWYLDTLGHEVTLCGRPGSSHLEQFRRTRSNGLITFPPTVAFSTHQQAAVEDCEILVVSVGAQSLRALMGSLPVEKLRGKPIVLCMKGIENGTGLRLSQVVGEFVFPDTPVAVWVGPGHVQEFTRGVPNCMVIDSQNRQVTSWLVETFRGPLIRFYYGTDLIGTEVGAASKNVIGIAAGMLDGLGLSSLKGALMARGAREIARLIEAMGGDWRSAYGLAHLGDYEATVFSPHSHNRAYGEAFVTGRDFGQLAEGVETARALALLEQRYQVELPICDAVRQVLDGVSAPREALEQLFLRSLKEEF